MTTPAARPGAGRPRASSRETLAEAACELFLERGFGATSVADITTRAGVSRSSFFNYFASKADVLWAGLDARIAVLRGRLADDDAPAADASGDLRSAVLALGEGFAPDSLALGIVHAEPMGIVEELEREAAIRRDRIARAVAGRLRRDGVDRLDAEVAGAAWGGAVIAAIEAWAEGGAGRSALADYLSRAADAAASIAPRAVAPRAVAPTGPAPAERGGVAQLRVVVQAAAFEQTLAFYRDVLGMPQTEAYEADGGARVAILEAGRATLEIADAAQVAVIDRVETDGDAPSERMRLAFQVADAEAKLARAEEAGAEVEATARPTPWNSLNARLRGPGGVQITLFQELDAR